MAVVVITGCSSGIGLATAVEFARRGDQVFASMRRMAKADPLRHAAQEAGVSIEIVELDVADDDSVQRAVAQVFESAGQIDVLVNNAGVAHNGTVELMQWARIQETFDTNFFGALRMIRAVLPGMREREAGTIVNVSSAAGRIHGLGFNAMYGASKHALGVMSEALAMEVGPFNIKVVVVEPGSFNTSIVDNGNVELHPGSPYAALEAAEYAAKQGEISSADDVGVVAGAIVNAATTDGPLHVLVGDDAELWVSVAESSTFEEWVARVERVRILAARMQ